MNPAQEQRTVLVTGSTDGLGREVARRLAATGAHVIIHGRSREKGQAVVHELEQAGSAHLLVADFSSLARVREFADRVLELCPRLDVLVNNAGIWLQSERTRQLSAEGHEMHFAVNYLATYLLTGLLLPRLRASAPARIVNVASVAQRPIAFDDVAFEKGYSPYRAYAQSKLAQVMFTFDLAEELAGSGVTVTALHPATLMDTTMVREAGITPESTIDEGARAVLHLVDGTDVGNGAYYEGMIPARAQSQAYDATARARLRALTEQLIGPALR